MISLYSLLLEVLNKPKAIFLSGAAGSGKSYISKQLIPSSFVIINSDDTYEELLKASGIGLKQKDFTPDQLSQAAKLQAQARKDTAQKLAQTTVKKQNLVIDGTGAASNPILKKKQELEDLGYECFMIMLYVSPLTSLQRNSERDRSLMPSIILKTWRDVNKNIDIYKQEFGENFILINNDPKDANLSYSKELTEPYFKDSLVKSKKTKSPEEIAKSKAEKEQLNKDIENMVKQLPKFDSLEQAKQKINNFIK